MRASTTTATAPPREPAKRSFTVTAEKQQAQAAHDHEDFFWTYTEEPHRTRRMAIIKAHPEVRRSPALQHCSTAGAITTAAYLICLGHQAVRP